MTSNTVIQKVHRQKTPQTTRTIAQQTAQLLKTIQGLKNLRTEIENPKGLFVHVHM